MTLGYLTSKKLNDIDMYQSNRGLITSDEIVNKMLFTINLDKKDDDDVGFTEEEWHSLIEDKKI
jgi:hypothetical protein